MLASYVCRAPIFRAVVVGLTALTAASSANGWTGWLDRRLGDLALAFVPLHGRPDVVVIEVDDGSLAEVGRWPWPRQVHARLIDGLADARAVGLNVGFSEPDRDPAADAALADAIRRHGRVVLPILVARAPWGKVQLPPVPALADAAAGLGHGVLRPTDEGTVRDVALWGGLVEPPFPAFALALQRVALGTPVAAGAPALPTDGRRWRDVDHRLIPFARFDLDRIPAADVLAGRADPARWRDRIVVVGVTAEGLGDRWSVAAAHRFVQLAGTELQARAVAGLTVRPPLRDAAPVTAASLVGLTTAGLGVAFLHGLRSRHLALLVALGPTLLTCAVFGTAGLWISPVAALLAGAILVGLRETRTWRHRRRLVEAERRRASTILDAIDDAVLTVDGAGRIAFANEAASRLTGRSTAALIGIDAAALLRGGGRLGLDEAPCPWTAARVAGAEMAGTELVRLPKPEGGERIAQASRYRLMGEGDRDDEELVVLTDVTELTQLHRELEDLAVRDVVTDLPNRQFVTQHLPQAIARTRREGTDLALLLIDLDHFKEVNDRFGHPTGDRLLRAVGARLRACCRADDVVARLGGDEFVVVMAGLHERHHAAILADKILRAFRDPIEVAGRQLVVEPSIGISCLSDQPGDGDALLGRADLAMYQAKHRRGAFRLFSPELDRAARDELQLRQDLREALARGAFELHFQPRVDLASGAITGCEALLRWQRPGDGYVPPDRFVPVAENAGLLEPLTEWVLDTALASWRRWRALHAMPLSVAVNVSARHFLQPEFVAFVGERLVGGGVPGDVLVVEITETMLMQDPARAIATIGELKRLGVGVSIDDFGTGYSSLAYLRDFPIDEIKIDRSFAARLGGDERDDLLVKAITAMAQSLRLGVVAEGVERPEQAHFLRAIGVPEAQGYLFSPPVPGPRIEALLRGGGRLPPP